MLGVCAYLSARVDASENSNRSPGWQFNARQIFPKYRILGLWLCPISAARPFEYKRLGQDPSDDPEHHPCKMETCISGFKNKSDGYGSLGVGAKNMDDHHARGKIMRHFSVLGPDRHSFTPWQSR
jgi:hypothetical protein